MNLKQTEQELRRQAAFISRDFPGLGFALIVFEHYKPGISNYISNSHREDMITALRETADRLEKNQDIPAIEGEA